MTAGDTANGSGRPTTATALLIALLATMLETVVRFSIFAFLNAGVMDVGYGVFTAIVGVVSTGLVGLVAWGVTRGWKATSVFVTLIGIWTASEILTWGDWLSIVSLVIGVASIVLVWLPTTRAYLQQQRLQRTGALST